MYAALLDCPRVSMSRKPVVDEEELLPFAKWLTQNIRRRGYSVQHVADKADMHVSQLHKIIKSYKPVYSQYQRPGYEKTVVIGKLFNDVQGALESAGYEAPDFLPEDGDEYDEHESIDFLRGMPRQKQDKALAILKTVFAEDDAKANAGTIGKRAE